MAILENLDELKLNHWVILEKTLAALLFCPCCSFFAFSSGPINRP